MTPYTALETLLAYLLIILTLLSVSVLCGTLAGLLARWLSRPTPMSRRTTSEDRREKLLKLIASTERKESR